MVSAVLFAGATVVPGVADLLYASIGGLIVTIRFGWKALTWDERTDQTVSVAAGSEADEAVLDDATE